MQIVPWRHGIDMVLGQGQGAIALDDGRRNGWAW